jgi:hypothetical protein
MDDHCVIIEMRRDKKIIKSNEIEHILSKPLEQSKGGVQRKVYTGCLH